MMNIARRAVISSLAFGVIFAGTAGAQGMAKKEPGPKKVLTPEEKAAADMEKALKRAKLSESFFSSGAPLEVTLTTNIKRIRSDKNDKAPWRPASFSYMDEAGKPVTVPGQIRTRGIWRRSATSSVTASTTRISVSGPTSDERPRRPRAASALASPPRA